MHVRNSEHMSVRQWMSPTARRLTHLIEAQTVFGQEEIRRNEWLNAGVISSVGLHTDSEFKAFTPAEGYNKNVTYKNGKCMHTILPCNCKQTSSAAPCDK